MTNYRTTDIFRTPRFLTLPIDTLCFPGLTILLRFTIGEGFLYEYNLSIPWAIDCRLEARGLVNAANPVVCLAARGHMPDEDLPGPSAYPDWFKSRRL